MAMTIMNDSSVMLTMGELNKNISTLGKQLKKVASGQRINSAGDAASEYSISEKMRVRLRALDQDERNVQNGAALLHVAEGAIQQQIEIMKTIKEKVIDADNDTNTDIDRATIQKEIDQGYAQIENIAYETTYNGKMLLVGDTKTEAEWTTLKVPIKIPESEMNFIPDIFPSLDGIFGPFDVFSRFHDGEGPDIASPLLGTSSRVYLTGGTAGTQHEPLATSAAFAMDLSGYTADELDGVGFSVQGRGGNAETNYYVLTTDTSKNYKIGSYTGIREININGLTTPEAIAAQIASSIKTGSNAGIRSAEAENAMVKFTTYGKGTAMNGGGKLAKGWSADADDVDKEHVGATDEVPAHNARDGLAGTGIFSSATVRGTNAQYTDHSEKWHYVFDPETDMRKRVVDAKAWTEKTADATAATLTKNISGTAENSGLTVSGRYGTAYVKFVAGTAAPKQDAQGIWVIGKNASVSNLDLRAWSQTGDPKSGGSTDVKLSLSNGKLTLTTSSKGAGAVISVTDEVAADAGSPEIPAYDGITVTTHYEAVRAFDDSAVTTAAGAIDNGPYDEGDRASYTIDLTPYDTTDEESLEEFISALVNKGLKLTKSTYEFIDTTDPLEEAATRKTSYPAVDLKALRTAVTDGSTIADAFIGMMAGKPQLSDGSDATTKGLKVTAYYKETTGNSETIGIIGMRSMSQYTIDFKKYFDNNPATFPDDLVDKGFRVYCATCPEQWFNFQFTKGGEEEASRPSSGSSGADIISARIDIIDISSVTDVKSLVEAICQQGENAMQNARGDGHDHFLHVKGNPEKGTVTIYDKRQYDVFDFQDSYPYLREQGAKIADGIVDDVTKMDLYVKDFVIHHTDHASQNIHVKIPQTTMDHIFHYLEEGGWSVSDFNVMTTESRERLLGDVKGWKRNGKYAFKEEKGALDRGLEYLTGANTLIGAQISRLGMTENNIVTSREATQISESTIRDADMAKEMTEYTKANVLMQAAQSMLAQANQNSSSVLSLLQ